MHFAEFESSSQEKFRIQFSDQDATRYDYWTRTSFTPKQWELLKTYPEELGLTFIISVFSTFALDVAVSIGVRNIKLGSGDLNNEEFYESIPQLGVNLILSTGMSTWLEIEEAVLAYRQIDKLTVLQCTSKYPTPLNEVGINNMLEIKRRFKVISGLSDHTDGISSSLFAIFSGADLIEKHVIFDRKMFGPDVSSSITFEELRMLSKFRNDFQLIQTDVEKDRMADSLGQIRSLFTRSLGLKDNHPTGYVIQTDTEFVLRKPGGGFPWKSRENFLGKTLTRDYFREELLQHDHFEK
jgi:N-acetylneuraminate synthase